jgi:hypothetical protein
VSALYQAFSFEIWIGGVMGGIRSTGRLVLAFLILFGLIIALLGCGPQLASVARLGLDIASSPPTVVTPAAATALSTDGYLHLIRSGEKSGFIDASGTVVVQPRLSQAQGFSEGFAAVQPRLDGKWGYIDLAGQMVIPATFDDAGGFSQGCAAVREDDKWGFIDSSGRVVIQPQYDDAGSFSEGLAPVAVDGKWGFIDSTGGRAIPLQYEGAGEFSEGLASVLSKGRVGFVDTSGHMAIQPQYDQVWRARFSDGRCPIAVSTGDTCRWGFVDTTGQLVIPPQYDQVDDFSEGLAAVQPDVDGKWGVIDTSGKLVLPVQYDEAGGFSEGLCPVRIGERWGFMDTTGRLVIQSQYDIPGGFDHGLAEVWLSGKRPAYIDKTGKMVWQERWWDARDDYWVGAYAVSEEQVAVVAQGYDDASFRPRHPVTRAQFAKMCVSGLSIAEAEPVAATFLDVAQGSTFYPYVEGAYAAGLILGANTPRGLLLSPDSPISREQANSILGRYLSTRELAATGGIAGASGSTYPSLAAWYEAEGHPYLSSFTDATDVLRDHAPGTAYLFYRGVVKGSSDRLSPAAQLNRGQAVALVLRTPRNTFGPGPVVTGLDATSGDYTGGMTVTITGANFAGATSVRFGDVPATGFQVQSSSRIAATSPAHRPGVVRVTVVTPSGVSARTSAGSFSYLGPADIEEREEYTVYSALIEERYGESGLIVIGDHAGPTEPADPDPAVVDNLRAQCQESTVESFITNNRERVSLRRELTLGIPYTFISDQQLREIEQTTAPLPRAAFWEAYYQTYPGAQGYLELSRVGFSEGLDEALVWVSNWSGELAWEGYYLLLSKVDGRWTITADMMHGVS